MPANRDRKLLAEVRQDVAYAVRQLVRAPAFTAVAVLTLALGIGATTAIFSAVWSVVLRPFPFAHPDRVVLVTDALCSSSDATHDALLTVYHQRFAQQVETVEMEVVLLNWT